MSHRPDLNSLSAGSRWALRNLMLNYINDAVVWSHNPDNPNAIVHHSGEHAFITHRNFIGDLERWLLQQGAGEFVPLPSWNPANPIPPEFNVVKPQDNGVARPALVNLNPSLGKPAGFVPPALCGIGNADALWNFPTGVDPWHGAVHVTIGGTMGDIHIAPAAPIFFCWHGYIDEIYDDWLRCRWSGWEDLGGVLTSGVGAASWAANRLDCFVKGTDNHMWHKWWNGAWNGWEDLGGVIDGIPAAVSWGPNRIDCFVRGMDNHMWHKWWSGGAWHGWEDLGGIILSSPSVASWGPNRLDCFARGMNGHMWHKWWNGAAWSGWEDLGGVIDERPTAVSWGSNRIDCFARGMNNHMWHKWWDGAWSGWEDLGGTITAGPGASSWAANRLDAFVKGGDNALWYKWIDASIVHFHAGTWSGWHQLGGIFDDEPGAVSWGPRRIDVFVRGTNNHMFHKWWAL